VKKLLFGLLGLTVSVSTIDARVVCKNLTCKEACYYLNKGHYYLDRDKDKIPCEKYCDTPCGPSKYIKKSKKIHKKTRKLHSSRKRLKRKYSKYYRVDLAKTKERYLQRFCKKMGGTLKYKIKDNLYIDCYTSKYSFKVDYINNSYSALRKAIKYKKLVKNRVALALIKRSSKDIKYINKIKKIAKKYNIKIFTIDKKIRVKLAK
jgi:hypothetical protein